MKPLPFLILLLAVLLQSCSPEPRPIAYGDDMCAYCKMTVVDHQHAAQAVTEKGRIYVFDAIECMVNYTDENQEIGYAHLVVNHFNEPKVLHAAESSAYLISRQMPSPMGAFLNAFPDVPSAQAMQELKGGDIYTWSDLDGLLNNKLISTK